MGVDAFILTGVATLVVMFAAYCFGFSRGMKFERSKTFHAGPRHSL